MTLYAGRPTFNSHRWDAVLPSEGVRTISAIATREQLENELARLVHAAADIRSAGSLLSVLAMMEPPSLPEQINREDFEWGLWTGAVVSYTRPFGSSALRIGERWERFSDRPELREAHRKLLELRDTCFGHTDDAGFREVVREGSTWDERRLTLTRHQALQARSLCYFQSLRISERIAELTSLLDSEARSTKTQASPSE